MMGGCFSTSRTDGTEDSHHISLRSLMAAKQTPLPSHCMAKKIIERKLGLNTRKTLQARTNLLDTACHNLAKAKQRTLVSFPPSYYIKSDTPLFPLPLPPGYIPSNTESSSLSKPSSISNSIKSKRIDVNGTNSPSNFPTSNIIGVNSTTSSFSSNSPRSPCHSQSNSSTTCTSSCEPLTPSSSKSSSVFSAAPSSLSQSSSFSSSSSSTNSSDLRCNSLAHAFGNGSSFFTPLPLPSSTHKVQAVDFPLREFSALKIARACDNFDDTYKLRDGSMGPFYKVYLPEVQSIVAIARVATKLSRKKWKTQIQMLASLAHPNVCKVIGFSYERAKCNMNGLEGVSVPNTGLIVYESIGNESLEEFVQDVEKGHSHIDWSTRLKIAIGVAEGLSFLLHKMPSHVSYGDLTMSNIIIDFSLNVKLFDFVLSSTICQNKEKKSSHMVQALGNVLLKLFNFVTYPYDGESEGLKERSQMEKAYDYPPRDTKLVIQLAASCLLEEDSLRPSIQHVACVLRSIEPTQHVAKFSIKRSKSFTYRKKRSLSFG